MKRPTPDPTKRRYTVKLGNADVVSRTTLDRALTRAAILMQRSRSDAPINIVPCIDIPADYVHWEMWPEWEACKKRHQQRQHEARKARRQKEKRRRR